MDSKENLRVGIVDDSDRRFMVIEDGIARRRGGMAAARLLAAAAGLSVVTRDAVTRAVDAGSALASALSNPKFRLSQNAPRGKRVSMSVATNRRTAAKKRRVKAHRARR